MRYAIHSHAGASQDESDPVLTVLQLTAEGVSMLSEDGLIRFTNAALEVSLGYAPGELVGRHLGVLYPYSDEENARLRRVIMDDLAQSGAWSGEQLHRRKDGSILVTACDIRPIQWRNERYWLSFHRGASSGHLASRSSSEEERLSIAADAAELGIWEWDLGTDAFIYSARARSICGLPAEGPITYTDVVRVTHPDDFPHTSAQAKRALDPNIRDRTPFEYRIVRPDGGQRWVRAHGKGVFSDIDGATQPIRYVGTLEDVTDRVTARLAAYRSARQVSLALESARMAVWSLDLRTNTVETSPELNQLFGFAADAKPSLEDIGARYAPGEREELRRQWVKAIDRAAPAFAAQFKILRGEEERWLQLRCDIDYAQREPATAIGVLMDVTEAHRAADALRESDARFREAADSAPSPVWMTNSEGKVEFGNRAMAEFAGVSVDDVMGDAWLSLMHPEDVAGVLEVRTRAWAANHEPYTVEARFKRADGEWRWLEVNSRARRDATGAFRGYVGLAVDRTDAHHALATLAESEERFRLLADSAPVMIWMSDASGKCLYLNAALRRFWDVDSDQLDTFDWRSTMHPEDEPRITSELTRATLEAAPFLIEGRYRNAEDEERIIRTQGVPRHSNSGEFLGMIGVNVDLTDLLEAQEHQRVLLEELNHRVKNTLAVVQSLAKQTFRSNTETAVARSVFEARLQALAGAHTLLTQSNWESASLSAVLTQAVQVCGEARSRIAFSGPDILLNPKQALSVSLALHELCTNALKHGALSNKSGTIQLTWQAAKDVLDLDWNEHHGPLVVPPSGKGFGSTLLERILPRDVQGEASLHFLPSGTTYRLSFPLAAR